MGDVSCQTTRDVEADVSSPADDVFAEPIADTLRNVADRVERDAYDDRDHEVRTQPGDRLRRFTSLSTAPYIKAPRRLEINEAFGPTR